MKLRLMRSILIQDSNLSRDKIGDDAFKRFIYMQRMDRDKNWNPYKLASRAVIPHGLFILALSSVLYSIRFVILIEDVTHYPGIFDYNKWNEESNIPPHPGVDKS
ncbi:hypothetical protein GQX74_015179 [Glossina fuscipes]|nr:hypothetical protein GQX74_015179 [Glossina fuscipes]